MRLTRLPHFVTRNIDPFITSVNSLLANEFDKVTVICKNSCFTSYKNAPIFIYTTTEVPLPVKKPVVFGKCSIKFLLPRPTNNFPVFFDVFWYRKKKRKIICSDLFNRNYLKFSIFSKLLIVKTKNRKIIYPVFLDVLWYRKQKKRKIICLVEV